MFPWRRHFAKCDTINICLTSCFGCSLRTFKFCRWRKLRKTWPVQRIFGKSKPRSLVGSWMISKSNTKKRFARFFWQEMSSEGLSSKSSYSREYEHLQFFPESSHRNFFLKHIVCNYFPASLCFNQAKRRNGPLSKSHQFTSPCTLKPYSQTRRIRLDSCCFEQKKLHSLLRVFSLF